MSGAIVRRTGALQSQQSCGAAVFRRRLTARGDVKGALRPGCSQNRQLMRGGRA